MNIRSWVLAFFLGGSLLSLHANTADSLRQIAPRMHGEARLAAYEKIYKLSVQTGEYGTQLRALDDYIRELEKQD